MDNTSNKIINKVYFVTDVNSCNDPNTKLNKFDKIKSVFTPTGKQVNKKKDKNNTEVVMYSSVDKKSLSEEVITSVSSTVCQYMCSLDMISRWLTHVSLWETVVNNGEESVLIVEDTANLIPNFKSMLEEYWKEVPADWDMLYLGCNGSCDQSFIKDTVYKVFHGSSTNDVYKENSKMVLINEPAFPLGLYGYMLTLKGAKKLLEQFKTAKVNFNLDYSVADKVVGSSNFKVYAFNPPLIINSPTKRIKKHSVIKPLTEEVKISKKTSLDSLFSETVFYIRSLSLPITYFSLLLLIVSVLIGYFGTDTVVKSYLVVVTFIQLSEIGFSRTNREKTNMLLFELLVPVYLTTYLTSILKNKIKNIK